MINTLHIILHCELIQQFIVVYRFYLCLLVAALRTLLLSSTSASFLLASVSRFRSAVSLMSLTYFAHSAFNLGSDSFMIPAEEKGEGHPPSQTQESRATVGESIRFADVIFERSLDCSSGVTSRRILGCPPSVPSGAFPASGDLHIRQHEQM